MDHEARKTEFLDRLYAAAVGADAWKNVLESYTRLVGGHASLLSFYDIAAGTARTLEWHNFSEGYIAASNARWKAFNPWSVAGQKLFRDPQAVRAGGFVSAGSSLVPQRELLKTQWYNEFAAEHHVQDCLTTVGISGGARGVALIANTGGRSTETYSSDQVTLAASVQKDVSRAVTLHVSSAESSQMMASAPGYMQMKLPVLVIHDQRIMTCNSAALDELESGRLIRRVSGKLFSQDTQLDLMIAMVGRKDGAHHLSLIATGDDGHRFLAQAIRFNRLGGSLMAAAGADDPAVMLVLTALDQGMAGREAAIRALGCFTPVEHAIAMALVNGQSIEDIARERRTSVLTIRWHLRNMSDKTGQSGSKGLTRMLTLLLPC